MTYNQEYI